MRLEARQTLIDFLNRLKKNPYYIELSDLISLILEDETNDEDKQKELMRTIYQKIEKLANTDSPLGLEALCIKGICANYGIGTKPDLKLGFKCYEEAAAKEFPHALLLLSVALINGEGVEKDLKQSFELCSKAAEKGLDQAYTVAGIMYLQGIGVEKDTKKGVEMLQQAIKQEETNAMTQLAEYLKDIDTKKAFELCSRAADLKDPHAIFCLAEYYLDGLGVSKDLNKGVNLLMKADELGEPEATKNLYLAFQRGSFGLKEDAVMEFYYLQKITSQMQKDIITFLDGYWISLAQMYAEGKGVAKDLKKTLQCYQTIENISPEAQRTIGWMYQNGQVPGKGNDVETAMEYFRKAAVKGDAMAKKELERLERGLEV